MKTLLIYPPYSRLHRISGRGGDMNIIPMGLACLSAYLKKEGHAVSVLDLNIKMYADSKKVDREIWHRENGELWDDRWLFEEAVLLKLQAI